jgi:hypothetical protein
MTRTFPEDSGERVLQIRTRTDVMIFKMFSPKNWRKTLAFLTQNNAILTLLFEKKRHFFFFRRKLSKTAENFDHNIDTISKEPDVKLCEIFLQKSEPKR